MIATEPNRSATDVRFAVATPADDAAIRRLLRENPMRGSISLTFEREPAYFRGADIGGADDCTIVAYAGDRLICTGRCTTRPCWINGRITRVGYLGELRLDRSARGRFFVLRDGYRFFAAETTLRSTEIYFTSIAADNLPARQLLERGLPGLPRYEQLAGLTTLLVSTATAVRAPGLHNAVTLEPATAGELADFLHASGSAHQFAAAWTPENIASLATHDLPLECFGVVRERGAIVAAGALWDQRRFRQTVIRGYSPLLSLARPVVNAFGPIFGAPSLPAPPTVLSHAFVSPLAVAPHRAEILASVVTAFLARAARRQIDFITLALPSGDPRLAGIRQRFRCRAYASHLYSVCWPGDRPPVLDDRPIFPDVSLL